MKKKKVDNSLPREKRKKYIYDFHSFTMNHKSKYIHIYIYTYNSFNNEIATSPPHHIHFTSNFYCFNKMLYFIAIHFLSLLFSLLSFMSSTCQPSEYSSFIVFHFVTVSYLCQCPIPSLPSKTGAPKLHCFLHCHLVFEKNSLIAHWLLSDYLRYWCWWGHHISKL